MHNVFTFAIQTQNMKATETNYLANIYRSITQSTSAKVPSYGYFLEMLKTAVKADFYAVDIDEIPLLVLLGGALGI